MNNLLISILQYLIIKIHALLDCIVDFCFRFYHQQYEGKNRLPPAENKLLLESAVDIAEKIRNKSISSETVVKTFIERCKEVTKLLNVIVDERFNDALEDAKRVDQLLSTMNENDIELLKKNKPFLGVPFTTKESNRVEGLLHSMGMLARKGYRSEEDATAIKSLKNSGAIIIAKTNIPEMNLWVESRNLIYGQSNNPYNITRTVGGSSGGDAAIVAACGVPFALGSDIGGSIRMPAFFNGVFGFKPSHNATPLSGIGLRSVDYSDSMAEAGPICKYAKDLIPLLKVIITKPEILSKLDTPVDVKSLKIFYQESSGDLRVSEINNDLKMAFRKVIDHFENVTGSAHKIKMPGTEYSYRLWRYWMSQEPGADFKSDITNRTSRTSAGEELKKLVLNKSEMSGAAILKLIDEDFFPKDKKDWAGEMTNAMRQYLIDKLNNDGVLFYPSSPSPANYHYSYFFKPYNFSYWALINVLKLPACQIPLGLDSTGMPIGIQVVAGPNNDHLCVAVAREVEAAFGGYVLPQ